MGNQSSEQTEKKVFDAVKNIPLVGLAYRAPRAIVYGAKGNGEEAKACA